MQTEQTKQTRSLRVLLAQLMPELACDGCKSRDVLCVVKDGGTDEHDIEYLCRDCARLLWQQLVTALEVK